MNIKDQVVLVTGAGSGIGGAAAREFAKRGAKVVILVDRRDTVYNLADEINASAGRQVAEVKVGDATNDSAGITRDALAVRLDKTTGKAQPYPINNFREVIEVNLVAPTYWAIEMVTRIAEDRFKRGLKQWHPDEEVQGAVVFIGSVSSLGNKGQISYAVSKAGLEGATATLTKEAMFHGVRCGIIHPGFTDTPMVRGLGEDYIEKNILPFTQLRRLIRPEEIADAICFMVTNPAVSGQLWADAGWHPQA
ncbi:MAG: short-chain dehydrogenase [Planctomycetota bacterium]|nr:MAG: short-chain dehydrogenase [Planctomycetota bacterium]